jgi:hypothetical protein
MVSLYQANSLHKVFTNSEEVTDCGILLLFPSLVGYAKPYSDQCFIKSRAKVEVSLWDERSGGSEKFWNQS